MLLVRLCAAADLLLAAADPPVLLHAAAAPLLALLPGVWLGGWLLLAALHKE